ncbi:fimbrial protein [Enterobacter sp. CGMCC 5087]|uniref:fimbrial protein n=1 Tax=Enterobacter sp. CGMCC 5087 TaxID=2183878 RepID=UPI0011B22E4C|nr:type 1 fimbrial protein [Enterobacter sp. CGMCC 5087]
MTTLKKCLATTMLMAGFLSGGIHAADVTINITGQVIAAACTTGVGSTYNIDLGQEISAATLNSAGAASTYVSQDIVLSDCPAGTTSVTATFDGTKDSGNDTMYANATGVRIPL